MMNEQSMMREINSHGEASGSILEPDGSKPSLANRAQPGSPGRANWIPPFFLFLYLLMMELLTAMVVCAAPFPSQAVHARYSLLISIPFPFLYLLITRQGCKLGDFLCGLISQSVGL
jgi:hypothetical protein